MESVLIGWILGIFASIIFSHYKGDNWEYSLIFGLGGLIFAALFWWLG